MADLLNWYNTTVSVEMAALIGGVIGIVVVLVPLTLLVILLKTWLG